MSQSVTEQQTTEKLLELPRGWAWATLGEIGEYVNGRAFKPSEWEEYGRPIIRIQNLTRSTNTVNRFSGSIEQKYLVYDGDFLISWSATLGAFNYRGEEAVLNQHIFKVNTYIYKRFHFHLVNAFINNLKRQVHGSGMQHITKGKFDKSLVPLAPLPEQRRIVAKIEELFTKLDAGVEALRKTKTLLKRYRQAVLKAAVEGPWPKSKLSEVIDSMKNGIYKRRDAYVEDGIACLRMYNIDRGKIVWKNIKRMRLTSDEVREYQLFPGDLLINRVNSRELVGKTASIPDGLETCVYESKNIRIRLKRELAEPKFISFAISVFGPSHFNWNAQQVVGMASISQPQIGRLEIPLPPLVEQMRLVAGVERRLSIADEVESVIEANLKRAERLRQSILKKAFEGKLVPQDPTDEPASVLLERIKAEKAKRDAGKKATKRSKSNSKKKQMRLIDHAK